MAILSDNARARISRDVQSAFSATNTPVTGSSADIRSLVDSADAAQNTDEATWEAALDARLFAATNARIRYNIYTRVSAARAETR